MFVSYVCIYIKNLYRVQSPLGLQAGYCWRSSWRAAFLINHPTAFPYSPCFGGPLLTGRGKTPYPIGERRIFVTEDAHLCFVWQSTANVIWPTIHTRTPQVVRCFSKNIRAPEPGSVCLLHWRLILCLGRRPFSYSMFLKLNWVCFPHTHTHTTCAGFVGGHPQSLGARRNIPVIARTPRRTEKKNCSGKIVFMLPRSLQIIVQPSISYRI